MPGFSGLRQAPDPLAPVTAAVSVPLPGFSGLRPMTSAADGEIFDGVSVPLPGFSGLRLR